MTEAAPAGAGQQPLRALLVGLTFITGMVDAVTYIGLGHVFAANMTGNVVLLGFALVGADQVSVGASLLSLVAFPVGAALGGRLASRLTLTGGLSRGALMRQVCTLAHLLHVAC